MGDSNSRHLAPKASALPTALIPDLGFEFCARCGQTCGQADFLTTAAYGEIACIAGVSRDCGHGIFRFEGGATRSQIKRATNCAIPGYLILNHYSTKLARLKDFSVCGHLCGQSRCCAAFGNWGKSRKRRRCKASRRFALSCPGYRHGTPKSSAIPTSLHPDIHFSAMIPRRAVKIKFFLSVVIYVVKAAFVPFSATGGKPAIARAARLCGLLSKPRMDRVYALPKQARYQLR